jgi:type I restriction-modification system DNA methylase subunit
MPEQPRRFLPQVSERTYYPILMEVIQSKGGTAVQEVRYESVPDIKFDYLGEPWLLSVKVGESIALIKSAFLQYLRHKEESGIARGILLLLPESMRRVPANEQAIRRAIARNNVTALIDAGTIKEEVRDRSFSEVIDLIQRDIQPRLDQGRAAFYSLGFVIDLLRAQVTEMMGELRLQERQILRVLTSWELLSGLARLEPKDAKEAGKFLAAYIVLSQIIFLRLFSSVRPDIARDIKPPNRLRIRRAFNRVLNINYKPIFEMDVLDLVPQQYLRDTFDLIWGMEIEKVRYELPGRIFHELMPPDIRKLLAAFYTRPIAAEILAHLAIDSPDARVLDPACGSGTILTAAYRAKLSLHEEAGLTDNPHKQFCEQDIFGCDIMPFAQHLTCANLAAMDVREPVTHTQIILGDSLQIVPDTAYRGGVQQYGLGFHRGGTARLSSGEEYPLTLMNGSIDVVLMNPPFTKVERGIREFVHMDRFHETAGGEVGLWGHFVFLADLFLKTGGIYGAVIPINILRGRESAAVRRFLFSMWTPLYVLKCTRNYGFSEWSEYRDVLLLAKKEPASDRDRMKFCLVKKDLTQVTSDDVQEIVDTVKSEEHLRSDMLDIDTHRIGDIEPRFVNLMWFCSTSDFSHRDVMVRLHEKFKDTLDRYEATHFREGYRPVPAGVSKFLFLTRESDPSRVEEAFLRFRSEDASGVRATTELGASFRIERESIAPSLRTPVGLRKMDITGTHDYITTRKCEQFARIKRAAGYEGTLTERFWQKLRRELTATETSVVVNRRINPYSPNTHLTAFVSSNPISPSNQVNVVVDSDPESARAFCVVMNSFVFWTQFFLLKEESTGRFIDIRFYDLAEMQLKPRTNQIPRLLRVFEQYKNQTFPSLRQQLEMNFTSRYEEFWEAQRETRQRRFWPVLEGAIEPSPVRVAFDFAVAEALGIQIVEAELFSLYRSIVEEMMITRSLSSD